jgi:hypothetical protein
MSHDSLPIALDAMRADRWTNSIIRAHSVLRPKSLTLLLKVVNPTGQAAKTIRYLPLAHSLAYRGSQNNW